ncbi:MAG: hypothetical protein AAGJ84_07645 [Pseudomonadota bacterium]
MLEVLMDWAAQPKTAWAVLIGAGLLFSVQAFRVSPTVFWADLIEDDE